MSIKKKIYVEQNLPVAITPLLDEIKFSGHVDINNLLARARKEKEKENKVNLFFLVLISALIVIFGIILSF